MLVYVKDMLIEDSRWLYRGAYVIDWSVRTTGYNHNGHIKATSLPMVHLAVVNICQYCMCDLAVI